MLDWLACTLVKGIGGLLCRLPAGTAVWLGARLGSLAYWLQPKRRGIGIRNLRAAFDGQLSPAEARRIIRACYRNMGASVAELLRLPVMDLAYIERHLTVDGRQHFDAAVASGRPVVLLTGHYGNWELSSIAAALAGYPIVALARAQHRLPKLYRLLVSYRESKGCTIVHKGGAMKRLLTALDERRLIGIVGDQASRQGLFVDFFGRPALFATGPFEMAHRKHALILPAFIRRTRGPDHHLVLEPPIDLSRERSKDEAVRDGIARFAGLLARHILNAPSQWLWMHKRWKHTPARRVLVLSDGKLGHVKQSLAVVDALKARHPELSSQVLDIRYRHPMARALAVLWSWWAPGGAGAAACLRWTLQPASAQALMSRYADLIVSCGAATAPVNLLWAAENRAKSVVLMNPAPLPLRRFSLVIAPRHDGLPARANLIRTSGALTVPMSEDRLRAAEARLQVHPRYQGARAESRAHPVVAVFLGGDTPHYELTAAFAEVLIRQVTAVCEVVQGVCLVTTSRRTAPAVERLLAERLANHPRCRLLLLASRDALDGTMEGMLGAAAVAVVTGESISMVSEACASGRRGLVVDPPLRASHRAAATKQGRFLEHLAREGYLRRVPVPELGLAIQRALHERQAPKRLDDFAPVLHASARLL